MVRPLRLAFTADLHWGPHSQGDEATKQMVAFLHASPPDVLILAGDVGAAEDFGRCLGLFDKLGCVKALVPGNHDIWVRPQDVRGDSLQVYRQHLPALCSEHSFRFLDAGPLLLPDADLAIVGSINWYDYSWSFDLVREYVPYWEKSLELKIFSQGRHNDARYVRWELDDKRFTTEVVAAIERHLRESLERVGQAIVVTHHPPFKGLTYPRAEPLHPDGLLWDAFSGNARLEAVLAGFADRIPFAFCGHTHCERENSFLNIKGYNIGGDYHFKRLLLLDWPDGRVDAHTFGNRTQQFS